MILNDLFSKIEPSWVQVPDSRKPADAVSLMSVVRIRRNIEGFPFPGKSSKSELYDSAAIALGNIGRSEAWRDCDFRMIDSLDPLSRNLLLELKMITPQFAQGGAGRFFLRDSDGAASCMINEEDHISIAASAPGLDLESARGQVEFLEASMDLELARDTVLGYLTANPNYVGTGMTASVLLHLPALDAREEMQRVCEIFECDWQKVALYRMMSDQNNFSGSFYVVSNRTTLAVTVEEIVSAVADAAQSLISKEIFARQKMHSARDEDMKDKFWRKWGLLRHARKLSFSEAMEAFSFVKLGSDLGILPHIEERDWRRMILHTHRHHLNLGCEQIIAQPEEPYVRASRFRQFIEARSSAVPIGTEYDKEL